MTHYELRTRRGKAHRAYDSEARARQDKPRAESIMKCPLELVRVVIERREEVLQ